MHPPHRALAMVLACWLWASSAWAEDIVRLCADVWMPFNGAPTDERPGYVVELAQAVFSARGVSVEYRVLSWEDALRAVREGRMSGAIGANKAESEGLVMPSEPIGSPPLCLVTRANSTWNYENIASFRGVKLGVIRDYSYWPSLDSYVVKNVGNGVRVVGGDSPLDELVTLLINQDVDVIAESEPVVLWHLRAHNLERSRFRIVYKHAAEPIYVAFAPTDEGRRFAALFDEGVQTLRASGELEKLLRRYGLRDWQ